MTLSLEFWLLMAVAFGTSFCSLAFGLPGG